MIILHGIFSSNDSMSELVSMVTSAYPGTLIHNIDGYDGLESMENLWSQVKKFRKKMLPIFENSPDGVNMICFSQGIVNFHLVTSCVVVVLSPCYVTLLCCHLVVDLSVVVVVVVLYIATLV